MWPLRIYTRIVLGLALLGLLVVASCAYAYLAVGRMTEAVDRVVEQEIPALSRLDHFQSLVAEVHSLETQVLSADQPGAERAQVDDKLAAMRVIVDQLTRLPGAWTSPTMMREFREEALELARAEDEVLALQDRGELFDARQLATDLVPQRMRLQQSASHLLAMYRTYIEEREGQNLSELRKLHDGARSYAAIAVLITALLVISSVRSVLVPLQHLVRVSRRIAGGDLGARADDARADEFGELGRVFNRMVDNLRTQLLQVAEKNGQLQEAAQEHRRQLLLAQNVQKSIVPRDVQARGLDVFARIHAARMIGGDFYDVQELPHVEGERPRIGLVVGDASGNGIPAALVMVLALALMREASRQTGDPAVILERVNRGILEQFPNELVETFVTASYVVLDLEHGRLRFASAGNEPPILWRRRDGSVEALEMLGMFLGTFEDTRYEHLERAIEPGDRLVIFSDGLTESRSPAGEFFGRERLEELVAEGGHMCVRALGEHILATLQAFSQEPAPRDDVALVVVEVREEGQ